MIGSRHLSCPGTEEKNNKKSFPDFIQSFQNGPEPLGIVRNWGFDGNYVEAMC
jgi:hypothetical protein